MLVAANGFPELRLVILILLAMVFARTSAMVFNRLADWEIDKRNPRTAKRHTLLSKAAALFLLILSSVGFLGVVFLINRICFLLSPLALSIIFFYSLTKRFTYATQLFLGLALAVAPVGAWLAVRGQFELPPLVLGLGVLLWVAGFDLIYATQDFEFDKREGLKSLVVLLGIKPALQLAQVLHAAMFLSLAWFGSAAGLGSIYLSGLVLIFGALLYEHRSAARQDINAINDAFFKSNAFVSFVFLGAVLGDLLLAA